MTVATHPTEAKTDRSPAVVSTIVVLTFLGISAVGGGIGFFVDIGMRDQRWLDQIPLMPNWVVPGLVLGIGFGLGSLVTAFGVARRPSWAWLAWLERATKHHWAWTATIALGVGMLTWVGLQLIWLDPHVLHAIYGAVGIALVALPWSRGVRDYLAVGS